MDCGVEMQSLSVKCLFIQLTKLLWGALAEGNASGRLLGRHPLCARRSAWSCQYVEDTAAEAALLELASTPGEEQHNPSTSTRLALGTGSFPVVGAGLGTHETPAVPSLEPRQPESSQDTSCPLSHTARAARRPLSWPQKRRKAVEACQGKRCRNGGTLRPLWVTHARHQGGGSRGRTSGSQTSSDPLGNTARTPYVCSCPSRLVVCRQWFTGADTFQGSAHSILTRSP
ncbi:unnamed protein product [Rangifer tarandus platyrhynchus]|uniref:Uncharacterized protein n=1 Tax=Rangifer tarandus platyrhynchus TaxID=3082113 RepID=A0ABN8YMR3_RANTA|nr:unnamed protein product [Rangifer tarandus platyrhynchus]